MTFISAQNVCFASDEIGFHDIIYDSIFIWIRLILKTMNAKIEKLCDVLESIADSVVNLSTSERSLTEDFGWNCPALDRHDLSKKPLSIAQKLRTANIDILDDDFDYDIDTCIKFLNILQTSTIPQLYSGNGNQAAPAYLLTMYVIEDYLQPLYDWKVADENSYPASIRNRVRALVRSIDKEEPEFDKLKNKISIIKDAYEVASTLPVDMEDLKQIKKQIDDIYIAVNNNAEKINSSLTEARQTLYEINNFREEAKTLVDRCDDAYRITSTSGLAASFDHQAGKLQKSMYFWIASLVVTLIAGGILSYYKFEKIQIILKDEVNTTKLLIYGIVSVVSVGAPLWFAWIATRQINQRFKLHEDYAFKASVAKAYEGYRKEAVRIDPEFERQLFRTALERLEEPPLRLMDKVNHSSPVHEFIESEAFLKAIEKFPDISNKIMEKIKLVNTHKDNKRDKITDIEK